MQKGQRDFEKGLLEKEEKGTKVRKSEKTIGKELSKTDEKYERNCTLEGLYMLEVLAPKEQRKKRGKLLKRKETKRAKIGEARKPDHNEQKRDSREKERRTTRRKPTR
mmetsp:Transcript_14075/g.19457  ORF Transcript_14075/g.19457 Transcript_14075/m.19457 type:complete len:108 (+) Transcript_14075:130-453(+)